MQTSAKEKDNVNCKKKRNHGRTDELQEETKSWTQCDFSLVFCETYSN